MTGGNFFATIEKCILFICVHDNNGGRGAAVVTRRFYYYFLLATSTIHLIIYLGTVPSY